MKFSIFIAVLTSFLAPGLCMSADKKVYGLHEYIQLPDIDLQIPAKLDTGAERASLSARNIKYFRRSGERWVSFTLAIDGSHTRVIEQPLAGIDQIKRRADDRAPNDKKLYTFRPVISLSVCMGQVLRTIEVNLTDRSAFEYPLLIGSEALKRFDAVVDPSLRFSAGRPGCASIAQTAK